LAAALLVGVFLHSAIIAYAAWLRADPPAHPPSESLSFGEVTLVVALDVPGLGDEDPGGGSIEPGLNDVAEGTAKQATPPNTPVQVSVPSKPPKHAAEPEPPAREPDLDLEHGNTDLEAPDDLFAMDELLTSENSSEAVVTRLEAKPAWRSHLTRPDATALAMQGDQAKRSRHYGSGPGKGGGPGGSGRGRGMVVRSASPFGGTTGAFRGQVCFVPRYTQSIKTIGACDVEMEVFADSFDVPPRHFEHGFPGVARDEWFAVMYSGTFRVATSGRYEFALGSDDGSILDIDSQRVIDNDGLHGPVIKRGWIRLEKGEHQMKLRYFQGPRTLVALQLWVTPPDAAERLFGPSF
jgi:hypothetical protein